jgi:hypothetical protein
VHRMHRAAPVTPPARAAGHAADRRLPTPPVARDPAQTRRATSFHDSEQVSSKVDIVCEVSAPAGGMQGRATCLDHASQARRVRAVPHFAC